MTAGKAWHVRDSLALRIALTSGLFGLVIAACAAAAGYWNLSRQLEEHAELEMKGRRDLLAHILSKMPSLADIAKSKGRFDDLFFGHHNLHLALLMPQTQQVVVSFSDAALLFTLAPGHAQAPADTLHGWRTPDGRQFSGWHGTSRLADGTVVEYHLSVDRQNDIALLTGFVRSTLLMLPALLLLVPLGAWMIVRTGLAPVRRFKALVASIGAQSLHARVSIKGLGSELADMAAEFNGMLERIDAGYRQLEEFAGDLAHEMRTPVATLLGRTQVALSRSRTAAELRAVMEGNVDELERLSSLIDDMLFIARADHSTTPIKREPVDLAREAHRVADYLSLIADEKGVQIQVSGQTPVIAADRLLIQRAITNLVTNAIRHAVESTRVTIDVASTGTETLVSVTNEGEAIAREHQARVFDRFFRADTGRARGAGGSGLGLAIVRSITRAHQGEVSVHCQGGRTTFTLAFPVSAGHAAKG